MQLKAIPNPVIIVSAFPPCCYLDIAVNSLLFLVSFKNAAIPFSSLNLFLLFLFLFFSILFSFYPGTH